MERATEKRSRISRLGRSTQTNSNRTTTPHMNSIIRLFTFLSLILAARALDAADYSPPSEGDYTVHDFKFTSGETLPELKIHYRTLGKIDKDASGKVTN